MLHLMLQELHIEMDCNHTMACLEQRDCMTASSEEIAEGWIWSGPT